VVGFGDFDEAIGGLWIVGVVIGMVFLAQLEELSAIGVLVWQIGLKRGTEQLFDVSSRSSRVYTQSGIMIRESGLAAKR